MAIPYRCVGFTGTTFLFVFDLFVFYEEGGMLFMLMRIKGSENSTDQIRRSG